MILNYHCIFCLKSLHTLGNKNNCTTKYFLFSGENDI